MYKMSHKDFSSLLNIVESVNKIEQYKEPFANADELFEDTKSFDAIMMNFIVIGEMAEKLSESFKKQTEKNIDWFKIKGLRNIIAHNYFGIDIEEIWQIIENSLLDLRTNIEIITKA